MADASEAVGLASSVRGRTVTLGASLKLYLGVNESAAWAASLAEVARSHPSVVSGDIRLFVMPSLPAMSRVAEALADAPVSLGAQDLFWEDRGAFTGGISGRDLAQLGCTFVEIGHAERRRVFGEDELTVRRKFTAAVRNDLVPVLCVGESEQQDSQSAANECVAQVESAIAGAPDFGEIVVAYEPEWAIGQAEPAQPDHVMDVCARLRAYLDARGTDRAAIIYGGSAKPGLLGQLDESVDGLFLGRFVHDPEAFAEIIDEAAGIR